MRQLGITLVTVTGWVAVTGVLRWAMVTPVAAVQAWFQGVPPSLDELLALVAGAVAWLLLSWLSFVTLLGVAAATPWLARDAMSALADRLTPAVLRHGLAAVLGVAVIGAPTAASAATSITPPTPTGSSSPGIAALDWLPDRAVAPSADAIATTPGSTPGVVIVAPGDTLWGLAATRLGPAATPAQIAAEWPRWYAENRDVIGPDPGLLSPGQRLVTPPS